jgi:nucleotide-binding universal stress UspA family protein
MELFKRILCPVDFSEFSTRAFRYAIAFAQQYKSEVIAFHCAPMIPVPFLYGAEFSSGMPAFSYDPSEELQRFIESFKAFDLSIKMRVDEGDPASRILNAISEEKADLVVMGTHGLGGYEEILMGSVTNKILHKTQIPVLTVCKPTKTILSGDPQQPLLIGKILCAVKAADIRIPMLSRAMAMARSNQATIVFFNVQESSQQKNNLKDLKELIEPEKEKLCKVEFAEGSGRPVDEIIKAIRQFEIDLVIMGHHSQTPMALEGLGSITLRVIPKSNCPVLVVRD